MGEAMGIDSGNLTDTYAKGTLGSRVNELFKIQKVLLLHDFCNYLCYEITKAGIVGASEMINPETLENGNIRDLPELGNVIDTISKEIKNKGIELDYLSQVKYVSPEAAKELIFEGNELIKKLGYEFKSVEDCKRFFVGDSEYSDFFDGFMNKNVQTFPSKLYQHIFSKVKVLRELAFGELFKKTGRAGASGNYMKNRVPGEMLQERFDYLLENQDFFSSPQHIRYVCAMLKSKYDIKRKWYSKEPGHFKSRTFPKKLFDAVDKIVKDAVTEGIKLEDIIPGLRVNSKKVTELWNKALEIIRENRKMIPLSNTSANKYFGEALSINYDTLQRYLKSKEKKRQAKSRILIKMNNYVTMLENAVIDGSIGDINLPSEYFRTIDGKAEETTMTIEEEILQNSRRGVGQIPRKKFEKLLKDTYQIEEISNLVPYNSFLEYIVHCFSKKGTSRSLCSLKPEYLKKRGGVSKGDMEALESIVKEIGKKRIKPLETRFVSWVYSTKFVELMEDAEGIIKGKYRKKFRSIALKNEYFGKEVTSTKSSYITYQRLKSKKDLESIGKSGCFLKLYEFVNELKKPSKKRKEKIPFPSKYFEDIVEPSENLMNVKNMVNGVLAYLKKWEWVVPISDDSLYSFISKNTSLDENIIKECINEKLVPSEDEIEKFKTFSREIFRGNIEPSDKYFESVRKPHERAKKIKIPEKPPEGDIPVYSKHDPFEDEEWIYHETYGKCKILKRPYSQAMDVITTKGEKIRLARNS